MASLLTRNESGNVYGFSWLVKHERRADIFKFVKSKTGDIPEWVASDPNSETILRDRLIWANYSGQKITLRACAKLADVSYETVRQVVQFYSNDPKNLPERIGRNDFRTRAREVYTRKALKDYREGKKTISDMAALLGPTADTKHAIYWIEVIGGRFEQRDREANGGKG